MWGGGGGQVCELPQVFIFFSRILSSARAIIEHGRGGGGGGTASTLADSCASLAHAGAW